jgi:hypothetical protein
MLRATGVGNEGGDRVTRRWVLSILCLTMALTPRPARANAVDDWSAIANQVIIVNANRMGTGNIDFAYVYIAIYDAVNAIDGGHTVFAVKPTSSPVGASPDAATSAAAYTVLKWLFPLQEPFLTGTYNLYVAGLPAAGKAAGLAVGTEVGIALTVLRTGDGRNANVPYVFQTGPGQYQITPGGPATPSAPWLGQMRTFAIEDATQFRADGPPSLTSAQWAEDFNEVKLYGALTDSLRTPEQTVNALFFVENPGQQISRNAGRVATEHNLSLVDSARFFAQVYVTIADAEITTWNSKYFYNFWRPVTAIRNADIDDNRATERDLAWLPLIVTPGHPEYPAAHPTETGALAYAIADFFGTKKVHVTYTSTSVMPGVMTEVPFTNTDDIVKYVIDGRVYGGLHYRTSAVHGKVIAQKVSHYVAARYFLPAN